MAASSKILSENVTLSLHNRLSALHCPFVDGLEDVGVRSLLFEQNDARLRVLQWLFSCIDDRLAELAETKPGYNLTTGLLNAASTLCLCSPDDIDLIQGKSPIGEQYEFIETLIDLAMSADSNYQHQRLPHSVRLESSAISASHQFSTDHQLLTTLARDHVINDLLRPVPDLFPPDLNKFIDKQLKSNGKTDKARSAKPEVKLLIQSAKEITERYEQLLNIQEEIDATHPLREVDEARHLRIEQQLRLLLTELTQLLISVRCLYDSHLRVWCTKTETEFTQLGSTVHRLHSALSNVLKVFNKSGELRRVYSSLNQHTAKLSNIAVQPVLQEIDRVGINGLCDIKSLITILDQAVLRH